MGEKVKKARARDGRAAAEFAVAIGPVCAIFHVRSPAVAGRAVFIYGIND